MKILTVVGARPQFIKAAALSREIKARRSSGADVTEVMVHTGQHYDDNMSKVFFEQLDIKEPDHHLGVRSSSHGRQTALMLEKIEEVLAGESPDIVVVYGDTNSTLAGALAASKMRIPLAHVEAGMRSFNRDMPEELNRVLTDHASDVLFCSTAGAVRNLRDEGIEKNVHDVGDIMYDAALYYEERAEKLSSVMDGLSLEPGGYGLVTVHRAANTDDARRLSAIIGALGETGMKLVFPLHPRTRAAMERAGLDAEGAGATEPVSYLDMLVLEKNARYIITDSGGVQKEAYFFGVPCVTLREETEWTETVDAGKNVLVSPDAPDIRKAFRELDRSAGLPFKRIYGDGDSAARMVRIIEGFV